MPQSLCRVYVHFVWSTRNRVRDLRAEWREELWTYLAGSFAKNDCPAILIGGVSDHIHALCMFSRSIKIKDLVGSIKESSTKWMKGRELVGPEFHWQRGYGAFSVSYNHVEPLKEYILNQENRHRREKFEVEYRRLLVKNGAEFDERYYLD